MRHDVHLTAGTGKRFGWCCHTCRKVQPNTLTKERADQESHSHATKGR